MNAAETEATRDVIGVIGTGVMGSAFGRHVVNGGYEVLGYDTDPDRLAAFAGAPADSVTEVAERCDIVLFSLPSAAALAAVSAEIAAVGRPLIAIEMGTLSLADKFSARDVLAAAGVTLLDSTVSGTGLQAADATLVVYCSGPTDAYERAVPIFELLSKKSYDLGEFGNGSRMKYVANLLVSVHTLAAAEAHALGAAAGLDPDLVQEVIGAGVGSSRMFEIRGPMMAADSYEPPSAQLTIILKDAGIISDFARESGATTPLLDAAVPWYEKGVADGIGELDAAALRRLL
ncbi:MAG: NAD(P)-dependent oxidoreductase [Acidimicrobiales bacterium]